MITAPRRTEIINRIQVRLSAGYPRQRLAVECGILQGDHLDRLIKRDFEINPYERSKDDDYPYYRDVDVYLEALECWLLEDETEQVAAGFAKTPTFRALHGVFDHVQSKRDIAAIVGGVGIGKSLAAKMYVLEHPRTQQTPGFVYVSFTKGCGKPGPALHAILTALIGEHGGRRADGLIHDIGREMRPGDGLILDECNYLVDALDAIRDLWDAYAIPIITMGNPEFTGMVSGGKPSFTAFASRVMTCTFSHTTEADVDAWMEWMQLSGKALRQLFVKLACRPDEKGGLRSIATLVERFKSMRPGEPLTVANLRGMAAVFGRGISASKGNGVMQ